ncbi:hypothetical protein [Paenibacillus rigui]|uniref:hypothetical protein n=1 Tax=Paenibacillus rigui TaxID=554312 RepID=UPI0015C661D3|nr:hypothetical protein [Paenibacillus rigui]
MEMKMEIATKRANQANSGLGWVIGIFSFIILCPLAYFLVNYLLGNENPYYGY